MYNSFEDGDQIYLPGEDELSSMWMNETVLTSYDSDDDDRRDDDDNLW